MRHPVALFASTVLAIPAAAQTQLVLPDNAHLGPSAAQAQVLGSTAWWGTTPGGRRMMLEYDASHFTGTGGVTSLILLTALRFRGENSEHNLGGQVYSGVNVSIYKTTLTSATMNQTSFAQNLAPIAPNTTSLITTTSIGTVTVGPSTGTVPNDDCIVLPLAPATIFDPVTDPLGEVNLLIDISWTGYAAAPNGTGMVSTCVMDPGNNVRGRGIYAGTPTATGGTGSQACPVLTVDLFGSGGHTSIAPARTERIGAACGGSPSTFYQAFLEGQPLDLAGTSLTMTPDNTAAPNYYTVTGGATPVDLTQVNATPTNTGDDAIFSYNLPFTFAYPGGSTTTIVPCSNGYVWVDPTMGTTDWSPYVVKFLGNASSVAYRARFAPCWHNWAPNYNVTSHPGSGLHVKIDSSGGAGHAVCYITWLEVADWNSASSPGGQSVNTFQMVMHEATGVVEFRYGPMTEVWGSGRTNSYVHSIVGFTRGRIGATDSVDPLSRDLSHEVPFTTGVEGSTGNVSLTGVSTPIAAGTDYGARMFEGQSLTWNLARIPAGTTIALLVFDLAASQPGIAVPGITAPGCRISTSASPPLFWETWVLPGSSATGVVPAPIPAGWEGDVMYAQAFGIDIFGGPYLLPWASNGIKYTVGLN